MKWTLVGRYPEDIPSGIGMLLWNEQIKTQVERDGKRETYRAAKDTLTEGQEELNIAWFRFELGFSSDR